MNDIKVGEYVRTKKGYIDRIKCYIAETNLYFCENGAIIDPKNDLANYLADIKHSENIIDLIECGDYVNGMKVHSVEISTNLVTKEKYIVIDKIYDSRKSLYEWQIKDIVTHEQFDSIKYVLGGKEE